MGRNQTPEVAARPTLPKYVQAVQYTAIDSAYTQALPMTERPCCARRSPHHAMANSASR